MQRGVINSLLPVPGWSNNFLHFVDCTDVFTANGNKATEKGLCI